MREELLSLVGARVLEMGATGDLSATTDPEAMRQARSLAESLAVDDLVEVRVVLGWWHWLRHRGTGDPGEFHRAVELLVPCFLLEIDALPEPMLPAIAVAASGPAVDFLRRSFDVADPQHLSAVIRLWQRITATVPADSREQSLYQSLLSSVLLERFLRVGDDADLEAALQSSERALRPVPNTTGAIRATSSTTPSSSWSGTGGRAAARTWPPRPSPSAARSRSRRPRRSAHPSSSSWAKPSNCSTSPPASGRT